VCHDRARLADVACRRPLPAATVTELDAAVVLCAWERCVRLESELPLTARCLRSSPSALLPLFALCATRRHCLLYHYYCQYFLRWFGVAVNVTNV